MRGLEAHDAKLGGDRAMADGVKVVVVQASTQGWFRAIITGGTGNLALLCDEYFQGATPIKSFDELFVVIGKQAGDKPVDQLVICGHGNETGFQVGEDWITKKGI